jgi:hypothetical protein
VRTRETGHSHTVGALDLSDDTVGRDGSRKGSNGSERVTHLKCSMYWKG